MKLRITITPFRQSAMTMRLVRQWKERAEAVCEMLVWKAAEHVRREVLHRIPVTEEWFAYRKSLELADVLGTPLGTTAVSIRANMRSRVVRRIEAPKMVLYVKPRHQRLRRTNPAVAVLQKYSPWTMGMLPFQPKRSEAEIVSRRVSRWEVDRVAAMRRKDQSKWRLELNRLGVREVRKDRGLKLSRRVKTLPDVAFEALRLEFGMGGVRARPHWRTAIQRLLAGRMRGFFRRQDQLRRAMIRWNDRSWRSWPPRIRGRIRLAEARAYVPFQKKLGIRVT